MGLDGVELVMECERTFRIQISDEDAQSVITVGDMQDVCVRLIREQTDQKLETEEDIVVVHEIIRRYTSEQLGVKLERVTRDAKFYDDLGMI